MDLVRYYLSYLESILMSEHRRVKVTANDYSYEGWLDSTFNKRSGEVRYVVEDSFGRCFIHNSSQIEVLE